jgi:hypothetical protein
MFHIPFHVTMKCFNSSMPMFHMLIMICLTCCIQVFHVFRLYVDYAMLYMSPEMMTLMLISVFTN